MFSCALPCPAAAACLARCDEPCSKGHALRPLASGRQDGLTLIELLVVIVLLGVLAAIALPNFGPTVERWRVRQVAQELQSTIQFARFESGRLAGMVSLRRNAPSGSCRSGSGQWDCGWFIFRDINRDGTQSANDGEETLRLTSASSGIQVSLASSADFVRFNAWGEAGSDLAFVVKPARANATASFAVCVAASGIIRMKQDAASC